MTSLSDYTCMLNGRKKKAEACGSLQNKSLGLNLYLPSQQQRKLDMEEEKH